MKEGGTMIGAIMGGMAEAFYSIPLQMVNECRKRLPEDMHAVMYRGGIM